MKGGHMNDAFGLNTERYLVSLLIQSECRKIRTGITPNTDTFYAVTVEYQSVTDEKAGVTEIRNQSTSMVLFCGKKKLCLYQPRFNRFWKIYFESLHAN